MSLDLHTDRSRGPGEPPAHGPRPTPQAAGEQLHAAGEQLHAAGEPLQVGEPEPQGQGRRTAWLRRNVVRRRGSRKGTARPVSPGLALLQFAASGVIALVVLAGIAVTTLHRVAVHQAIQQATDLADAEARLWVAPAVTDRLVSGDAAAFDRLDRVAHQHLLSDRVVRVKLWTEDGRIVYSDEPRLIGQIFPLAAADVATLKVGKPAAQLSDLSPPENQYERGHGRLLEVYERVETDTGQPLLFEVYLRLDQVTASAQGLAHLVAPAFLLALLALETLQIPLAWRLVRRIAQGHRERAALNRRVLEASDHERRRIARDLHDGVVQSLAGMSYALAAIGGQLRAEASAELAESVEEAGRTTRRNLADLRSLIFEISPPNLQNSGLPPAIRELTSLLTDAGIRVDLETPPAVQASHERATAIYRAAQEALRNVVKHSAAAATTVVLAQHADTLVLTVEDDGVGFDPKGVARDDAHKHFGLSLLDDLARESGGTLLLRSSPGHGTTLRFELPAT